MPTISDRPRSVKLENVDGTCIPLSNGGYAVVDDADAESVSAFRWRRAEFHGIWYAVARMAGRKCVRMHRVVLGIAGRPSPHVDHRNHDGLDNRRRNLRAATFSQNATNRRKWGDSSRFKGVGLARDGKWVAKIRWTYSGGTKDINLGRYESEAEAALAFDVASRRLRDPEFLCPTPVPREEMPHPGRLHEIEAAVAAKLDAVLSGRKGRVGAASQYHGVHFATPTGKWNAMIRVHGTARFMGGYATEVEAAYARDRALGIIVGAVGKPNGISPAAMPDGLSDAVEAEVLRHVDRLMTKLDKGVHT